MYWIYISLLLFLPVLPDEIPELINSYKNSNRLILLFAPDNRNENYEATLLNLSKDPLGLDQRDILIFEIFTAGGIMPDGSGISDVETGKLRNFYQVEPDAFRIVLVDQDNKEVRRYNKPVTVKVIFTEFDSRSLSED